MSLSLSNCWFDPIVDGARLGQTTNFNLQSVMPVPFKYCPEADSVAMKSD